jgi:hypothetical protein
MGRNVSVKRDRGALPPPKTFLKMQSPGHAGYQQYRSNMDLDAFSSITNDTLDKPLPTTHATPQTSIPIATRIGWLFLLSNSITIIFTALPVLIEMPDLLQGVDRRDWYGVDDIFRLLEPILVAPVQFMILLESQYYIGKAMNPIQPINSKRTALLTLWFTLGMAIYQQGAGFHSAANMIKNAIETVRDKPNALTLYPVIREIHSWTRDLWQHIISHYMVV